MYERVINSLSLYVTSLPVDERISRFIVWHYNCHAQYYSRGFLRGFLREFPGSPPQAFLLLVGTVYMFVTFCTSVF